MLKQVQHDKIKTKKREKIKAKEEILKQVQDDEEKIKEGS